MTMSENLFLFLVVCVMSSAVVVVALDVVCTHIEQ